MNEIFERYGTDPISLSKNWLAEASQHELNDPEAANLATANSKSQPSNRMVLIKEITNKGFKFHTNAQSQKGKDIAENPCASLCFYWKSTRKQIRITGTIQPIESAQSSAYFATRSIERQIGAWASQQSTPFDKRADMEATIKKYEEKFSGTDNIPRPPYWKGYILTPETIEFWIAQKDRLHTRFIYTREENKDNDEWNATWLCP